MIITNKQSGEPFDIYCGRPSKWGNPFQIGKDGNRDEVIEKYSVWIMTQTSLLDSIGELEGKRCACWCYPKKCHLDILKQLLEQRKLTDIMEF